MSFSELEKRVLDAIDSNKDRIIDIAKKILSKPETGFKEHETAKLVSEVFSSLSIPCTTGHAVTGVKASLGADSGFNVCLIGELDSVICAGHPYSNPVDNAAHACGHHGQIAWLLGAAIGLSASNALSELPGGKVTFMAVPAEEYIDTDFRQSLKDEGKIKFFSGKQQLIYEGEFDNVDVAMMMHAQPDEPNEKVFIHSESLGFVMKSVTFKGKSVHAAKPYDGVNALNAAALAILGIHANRETFREEDKIKVHFIITKGGDIVNAVPSEVCLECQVRGANIPAMMKAAEETDRAIKGAAMMVGAEVDIKTTMGYQPFNQSYELGEMFASVACEFIGNDNIVRGVDMTGSSDIGDLSHLLPTIQPMVGGFTGQLHSKEFAASDDYTAYVLPAKIMAVTAIRLLKDGCKLGKEIKSSFTPTMSKDEYLKFLED